MVGRMGRLGEITIKISDQTLQSSKNCFLATIHNGLEIEKYCKVYFYLLCLVLVALQFYEKKFNFRECLQVV